MIKLGLDFTAKLQTVDHWDHLDYLYQTLEQMSGSLYNIHHGIKMNETVVPARKELAEHAAYMQVYLEIIKMKLCIGGAEWDNGITHALEVIEQEYDDVEQGFSIDSLI